MRAFTRPVDLSITYVYVIDESLQMSKGKIAAQVSHIAMLLADEYKFLGRAIILKAPHSTIMNMITHISEVQSICDAGLNEVPPNTLTCIGFKQTDYTKQWTKDLKLV